MTVVKCVGVRPTDVLTEHHTVEDQVVESGLDGAEAGMRLGQRGESAPSQRLLGMRQHGENPSPHAGTER